MRSLRQLLGAVFGHYAMVGGDDRRALRPDALIRLKELDPNLKLVRLDEKGVEYVAAEDLELAQKHREHSLEDVRSQVVAHRVRTAQNLFGEVVGFEGCKSVLSSLGRAVLVEFVVQERDTMACLVRPGLDEPIVVRTLQGLDVDAWGEGSRSLAADAYRDHRMGRSADVERNKQILQLRRR